MAAIWAAFNVDVPPRRPIHMIMSAPITSNLVLLEGTVRAAGSNRLALTDPSGEIRLITCPAWYRPLIFGARERVRVVGHLAPRQLWRADQPTFLVYRIDGDYGSSVTLRRNDGLPLWHRYRAYPGRRLQEETERDLASANSPQ